MIQKVIFFLLFISILFSTTQAQSNQAIVSGKVINSNTREPLAGCNILVKETSAGTAADDKGGFMLRLPYGNYSLQFSYVGFQTTVKTVSLSKRDSSVYLEVDLIPGTLKQGEVTITGDKEKVNTELQSMEAKDIKMMPNLYNDVLRSVQVMAGVSTNNELTSGYNVRGGSFDENIIYLNGFEIYRPFLVKQGIEENQSLINPDMVSGMHFYNGEFPARFGDRMSSVLEVDYESEFGDSLSGVARVDFTNLGINIKRKYDKFNVSLGVRYAYPDSFLDKLQTTGDYIASFSDVQLFTSYSINENNKIELQGMLANNKYFLSPDTWEGNFGGFSRRDYRGIKIDFSGENEFKYKTYLAGIRFTHLFSNDLHLNLSAAYYKTNEIESRDTEGDIYYNENANYTDQSSYEYLKTRYEFADNEIKFNSFRLKAGLDYKYNIHTISAGAETRFADFDSNIDEKFHEIGVETLVQKPDTTTGSVSYSLNNYSAFVSDEIKFSDKLKMNIGFRFLHYDYSDENLFSPRAGITFSPSQLTTFSLGWGYYYQPPFVNELKNPGLQNLKSQRAIHYALGWEQLVNEKLKLSAEVYYKDLDYLVPFYFDELKMIYVNGNTREGYSYGLDLQLDGELISGLRSIIGYGYLNSKERDYGTAVYQRRLLDQTHTIQVFLQSKFKRHENWQMHLRFLLGSGQLYYARQGNTDEATGERLIDVDINNPLEYFLYLRVDLGLSTNFNVFNDKKLMIVGEVMNLFNHRNYGSYDWIHVSTEYEAPFRVPRILSSRFFNIKAEFRF